MMKKYISIDSLPFVFQMPDLIMEVNSKKPHKIVNDLLKVKDLLQTYHTCKNNIDLPL